MAKNTSKKASKKQTSTLQKLKTSSWYVKGLVMILIGILGFQIFKYGVNAYNISLLDKAEEKMRQMDLPKADTTEYKRSCSFRSVKFGSAGSPNCHIQRIDTYDVGNDINVATDTLRLYLEKINSTDSRLSHEELRAKLVSSTEYNISDNRFPEGLKCGQYISFSPNYSSSDYDVNYEYLVIANNCSRRFMFQTYPENI